MFGWSAVVCLAAASVAYGFPGVVSNTPTEPSENGTVNVSEIKTRIKLILEQTSGVDDKNVLSNSSSPNFQVEKCDASCDCSGGKCVCSGGQCSCSEGQCVCPTGCENKKATGVVDGFAGESSAGVLRVERDAAQKVQTTTTSDDEDEDEDEPQNKPEESDSEDIIGGYEAMLNRERQLYVRSVSDQVEKEHTVDKRDAVATDWMEEFFNEKFQDWSDAKPSFKDWDFLYPNMNRVRLASEAKGIPHGEPSGSRAGVEKVTEEPPKEEKSAEVDGEHSTNVINRLADSGPSTESGLATKDAAGSTEHLPDTVEVAGVLDGSKSVSTNDQNENVHKMEGPSAGPARRVKEVPKEASKPVEASSEVPSAAERNRRHVPPVRGPEEEAALRHLKSALEASWGSGTYDPDEWQEERRLGDTRSVPNFNHLDIRYLGGNDLNIPLVNYNHFNSEDVTGRQSKRSGRGSSFPSNTVDLTGTESSGGRNAARFPMALLAFAGALRV